MWMNACTNSESVRVSNPIFDIPLDSVPSEIWFPDLMAVNTNSMVSIDSKLCLISPNEKSLTYFIDEKNAGELGYAGIVGEGPEDMQPYPSYAGISSNKDTIYLYDFNARRIKAYTLKDKEFGIKLVDSKNLVDSQVGIYNSSYMNINRLENGYYVGLNYLNVTDNFLTLLDRDLNVIKTFGKQPLEGLPGNGKIKSFKSFNGIIRSYGNSVFYAASKFGYIVRYDVSNQGEVSLVWEHRYANIDYFIDEKEAIKFRSNSLNGFSDMTVGKEYIFATYSGIPFEVMFRERNVNAIAARTLAVFNHSGEALGRFKLRSCSFCVGLSEDEEYLYVMNIDPEVQIERLKVRDIIEKLK